MRAHCHRRAQAWKRGAGLEAGRAAKPICMCNRYASDIRKAGLQRELYGFEEWSETRIVPLLGNAVLEVFPKSWAPVLKPDEHGELQWTKKRWGLPGPPHSLFSFLTTEANDTVRPVHAKAMPVILTNEFACKEWLNAPPERIEEIQARVLSADALEVLGHDEADQYTGGYLK